MLPVYLSRALKDMSGNHPFERILLFSILFFSGASFTQNDKLKIVGLSMGGQSSFNSLDIFLRTHEYSVNVLNNINTVGPTALFLRW